MIERTLRADKVLAAVTDLVVTLMETDRAEDADLSTEDVVAAIREGEVSVEDIMARFHFELVSHLRKATINAHAPQEHFEAHRRNGSTAEVVHQQRETPAAP